MKNIIVILSTITISILVAQSCKHEPNNTLADRALYSEMIGATYTYFQNGNTLPSAPPSPHGSFKLRFNTIAASALDSTTGELPIGSAFPNGSIIVKDIFTGSNVSLIAVMKKSPSDANASNGWVWAEYNPDGTTYFSTSKNGDGCTGCHSSAPNRDFTKAFDLH